MENLIVSALRAFRSLLTPGIMVVFLLCVAATVVALMGFVASAGVFFHWLAAHLQAQGYAFGPLVSWIGSIGASVLAWFLFPGIMPIVASFFDERIAEAIERQEYPASVQTHKTNLMLELLHDLRFAATAILLNILALPFYLLPLANIFLFFGMNGWLLGREFFVMAARRHMTPAEAEALRKQHGKSITLAGAALVLLATIPIANLFAPFWGIALMVHLYHRLAGTPDSKLLPPQKF